jgi:DNA polymerase-3 subunit gamma/tau
MYAPSGDDRYKVYIVDEAHMLTREAWNALLKILEEPPPRVVFVFATTEPQKIAQAAAPVLSRLQRFDFKRIGPAEIKERLTSVLASESIDSEPQALAMIARAADGSMRDALSLTDQVLAMGESHVTADRVREALGLVPEDELLALLDLILDRRAGEVFSFVGRLADSGIDFGLFLGGLADILRAQLAVVLGGTTPEIPDRVRAALDERRARWSASDLLRMLGIIGEFEPRFRKSGQQQLLIETLLVRFALMDRTVEIEELLKGLNGEGSEPSPGTKAEGPRSERTPPRQSAPQVAPVTRAEPRAITRSAVEESAVATKPPVGLADVSLRTPPRAAAPGTQASETLDLPRLTGHWDELVGRFHAEGKRVLASALEHALPVTVTAAGEVTLELDEPNEFMARAIESGRQEIVAALKHWFDDIRAVRVRHDPERVATPPTRVTDEMVRSDRLAALRKRDPTLGAAIDALDLDVIE